MTERKQTLALAESCTGGCIAHRVTNVPGASTVFLGGVVAYSNAAKQKFLGVRAETLARARRGERSGGARNGRRARGENSARILRWRVTGIAGPGGGTKAKPVGTVFIALAGAFGTMVERRLNPYERKKFKEVTARQALALLHVAAVKIWHALRL